MVRVLQTVESGHRHAAALAAVLALKWKVVGTYGECETEYYCELHIKWVLMMTQIISACVFSF